MAWLGLLILLPPWLCLCCCHAGLQMICLSPPSWLHSMWCSLISQSQQGLRCLANWFVLSSVCQIQTLLLERCDVICCCGHLGHSVQISACLRTSWSFLASNWHFKPWARSDPAGQFCVGGQFLFQHCFRTTGLSLNHSISQAKISQPKFYRSQTSVAARFLKKWKTIHAAICRIVHLAAFVSQKGLQNLDLPLCRFFLIQFGHRQKWSRFLHQGQTGQMALLK